jgi:hypothetical protein
MDPLLKYSNLDIPLHLPALPCDDPIPRRVPLAGNVTVSSRTELYHDLLYLYASQLMPPALALAPVSLSPASASGPIPSTLPFPPASPLRDLYPLRQSIHFFEQSLGNTARLVYALCSLVEALSANDSSSWSAPYRPAENLSLSRRQLAILFSIRSDIRLTILQYLLGLDERWSLEATIAACRFVKRCLENSVSLDLTPGGGLALSPAMASTVASPFFRFSSGRGRRSKLYPSSTLGLLALALPPELSQRRCRVLFSLDEDEGIGIVTLKRLLHEETSSVSSSSLHSQQLLLLLQDSYGHLFGAFLSLQRHHTDLFLPQHSFLFRALPDLRTFPLLHRSVFCPLLSPLHPLTIHVLCLLLCLHREGEEQLHSFRWFSSSGIHIGSNSSASPTFSYASSSVLFLDPSFSFGHTSAPDPLLANERLSLGEEFRCTLFEVWTFSDDLAEEEEKEER